MATYIIGKEISAPIWGGHKRSAHHLERVEEARIQKT